MTGERPIAGAEKGRGAGRSCGLALACVALVGVVTLAAELPASAQEADGTPAFESGNPLTRRNPGRRFGLESGRNDMPALRGVSQGSDSAAGNVLGGAPSSGEASGGDGVSRLPRFRTGGLAVSTIAGGTSESRAPSLLQQRAAPPRRFGFPTRQIVRTRTQGIVTDLRLTPVVRNPVSGVPSPPPLPSPYRLSNGIGLLALNNPSNLLLNNLTLRRPDEADPAYAPLGLRLGTFTVLPALTQSIGYDSNPNQTVSRAAKGSLALRTEGEVAFRSDWSSSEFSGELRGGYSAFPQDDTASRPNANGVTRMRIDANRDTRIELETRFLLDTQRYGTPDLGAAAATSRPIFATYGATAGVTESFNRLQLGIRGSIDRNVYEDARLSDGSVIAQADRNSNQYGVRLRAGYEISPILTPFVEVLADTRVYDNPVDSSGIRRDSDGIGFTAGTSIRLTSYLSGEISAGLQHRDYVDPSLRSISAPLVNTALVWQISPLTTVRFNQATGVIETSVPGSSGVFTDVATLEVQHDLLRNLSITVGGAYVGSEYQGVRIKDNGYSALARLDYRFNRWLTLRGSYLYTELNSTNTVSSYSGHIVMLGLRVNP